MISFIQIMSFIFLCGTIYASNQPNILWITSEDNNISWIGAYGNTHVNTPNINRLADEGFKYTHAYANAPVCAPSRSTWITGMYALTTGTQHMRSRNTIPHNKILYYPDILKKNGYFVGNSNKTDYNIGGRDDKDCWDNSENINWEELQDNQPFFQVVNFYESHESRAQGDVENTLYDPAKVKLKSYHPDLPIIRKNYAKYHDALTRMDDRVGEVLSNISKIGLNDNTIVIYSSDHGGVLPRSKRYLYTSGLHCPLIVRIPESYKDYWPAEEKGSSIDRLISFIDMPITWLSLAGVNPPERFQGKIFLGKNKDNEEPYHFAFRGRMDERYDEARAVHNKQYLYIKNYMPWAPWVQHLEYQWKIQAQVAWEDHINKGLGSNIQSIPFSPKVFTEELYDMKADPDCVNNLINNSAFYNIREELSFALKKWQLKIFDSGLLLESEMNKRALKHNLTIYEMIRDPSIYPLEKLINSSNLALERKDENKPKLKNLLNNPDSGIRYWGAVGLLILNDHSQGYNLIKDTSHEVRSIGAWMLVKERDTLGLNILFEMLNQQSDASLFILNILDWIGEEANLLHLDIKKLNYSEDKNLDKMQNFLLSKWNK
ncbi:MAG: sulfatase [Pontiellaceae bacterium]